MRFPLGSSAIVKKKSVKRRIQWLAMTMNLKLQHDTKEQ